MRKRRRLEEILYFWIVILLTVAIITNSILLVMFWEYRVILINLTLILGVFLNMLVALHRLYGRKRTAVFFILASIVCLIFLFVPMNAIG
ncbi:MAG: hypothetical protein J6D46_02450 [Lachnospiraceae bacterium]|nr:hypothetical protein [Lachnospiraceae bacterium]